MSLSMQTRTCFLHMGVAQVPLCNLVRMVSHFLPSLSSGVPPLPPLFEEAQSGREKLQALQVFDMADHGALIHAEFARDGGIGRRVRRGGVLEVALDSEINRKSIGANFCYIGNNAVLNISVRIGWGGFRRTRVHTTPFQGTASE